MTRKVKVQTTAPRASVPKPQKKQESPRKQRSLRERRERSRNLISVLFFIVAGSIIGGFLYGVWRPEVRITGVEANEVPDALHAQAIVTAELQGTYSGILPKNSIFFYPEEKIISELLNAFPSLERVVISRNSFTTLNVEGVRRQTAVYWCGETTAPLTVETTSCFEADAHGFIFSPVAGSTSEAYDPSIVRVYTSVEREDIDAFPLRSTITKAEHLVHLQTFVVGLKELGIPVLASFLRGDEADIYVTPKTRLRYVLGKEVEALTSAKAAFADLPLLNGSIEYVDVRFPGKLYVKRYEDVE